MKRHPCFITIMVQLFLFPVCNAQDPVKISNTDLGLKDSMIVIGYDLEGKNVGDLYAVRIEVMDENGKLIHARALSGDVGENVAGGKEKQILWDYQADSLFIDADIAITVFATLTFDATPKIAAVEENIPEETDREETDREETDREETGSENIIPDNNLSLNDQTEVQKEEIPAHTNISNPINTQQFNRAGLVIQSIAFPGLGLSRVTGNPHWIKGILGYGCVAGSLIFYSKSNKTTELYDSSTRTDWRTYYHEKSVWQYNMSLTFAAAAAGIWVSEIIWTVVGTSNLGKIPVLGDIRNLKLGAGVDPVSYVPFMRLNYVF